MEFTSANHKPDGIWVNDAQTYVATAGEIDGQLCVTMLDGPNGAPSTQTYANLASDSSQVTGHGKMLRRELSQKKF